MPREADNTGGNERLLSFLASPPPLYAPSSAPFWDDEHISKQMLDAHLAPDIDAASRSHAFIRRSAEWIAGLYAPCAGKRLLDLGCGPGLYAELFADAGFSVTGIDLSRRSIAYARERAEESGHPIEYILDSYLSLEREEEFDIAVMIYCDFGVLCPADRKELLSRVLRALKPGGLLVLDAFTAKELSGFVEGRTAEYSEGGFWSPEPHLCITTDRLYPETDNYLEQYVIVTANGCERYNIWNQVYTADSLGRELSDAGFGDIRFFGDIAGSPVSEGSSTICAVCRKPEQ